MIHSAKIISRLGLIAVVAASSFITSPRSIAYTHPVPETMLAAAFDRGGGPEVLSIHRMPVPKPHAGEVLIAVYATGCKNARLGETDPLRDMSDVLRPRRCIFGVEGAAPRVNLVTHFEAAHAGSNGSDGP